MSLSALQKSQKRTYFVLLKKSQTTCYLKYFKSEEEEWSTWNHLICLSRLSFPITNFLRINNKSTAISSNDFWTFSVFQGLCDVSESWDPLNVGMGPWNFQMLSILCSFYESGGQRLFSHWENQVWLIIFSLFRSLELIKSFIQIGYKLYFTHSWKLRIKYDQK